LLLVVVALGFNLFVKTQTLTQDILYTDVNRTSLLTVPLLFTLVIFFLLITATFVPLGQKIGVGLLTTRSPLSGYILNILGSVLGVVAFSAVSFLQLAPAWWFGLALLPLLWFVRREKALLCANLVAVLITITNVTVAGGGFVWSPYHKITASPLAILRSTGQLSVYNGTDQQSVQVLPPEFGFHVAVDEDFLQMALNCWTRTASSPACRPSVWTRSSLPLKASAKCGGSSRIRASWWWSTGSARRSWRRECMLS
jgi:hypothetical protein